MNFFHLTADENCLLQLFLKENFPWYNSLIAQVLSSKVDREDLLSSYFVDFKISDAGNLISIPVRKEVPLEIIIGNVEIPQDKKLYRLGDIIATTSEKLYIYDDQAFAARLHFKDGYLFELEAYSISGQKLQISNIQGRKLTYIITDKKYFNIL